MQAGSKLLRQESPAVTQDDITTSMIIIIITLTAIFIIFFMAASCGFPGDLPVLQVWCNDAAEEVGGWLKTWKGQTGPQRPSVHRAVGDSAVVGYPLQTDHKCSVLVRKKNIPTLHLSPCPQTYTSSCPLGVKSGTETGQTEHPAETSSLTR